MSQNPTYPLLCPTLRQEIREHYDAREARKMPCVFPWKQVPVCFIRGVHYTIAGEILPGNIDGPSLPITGLKK
jgi:hypothetical protein